MGIEGIEEHGFYVNEKKGYVREVARMSGSGSAHWRAYFLSSGEFAWTGSCSAATLSAWADREATAEEISRLRLADAVLGEIEEGTELVMRVLAKIPDGVLMDEARRRGLIGGEAGDTGR